MMLTRIYKQEIKINLNEAEKLTRASLVIVHENKEIIDWMIIDESDEVNILTINTKHRSNEKMEIHLSIVLYCGYWEQHNSLKIDR